MKEYRVKADSQLNLDRCDPDDTGDYKKTDQGKEKAKAVTAELTGRLGELQERLYANGARSLLIVLQGMDTSGKDGTIRSVMSGVNPQGCKVVSFKAPSSEELGHDTCGACIKKYRPMARSASSTARIMRMCSSPASTGGYRTRWCSNSSNSLI